MLLLIVAALVLGGLIGDNATIFPWLGYSKSFQFMPDSFLIDTDVLKIAFGLYVKANVCQILLLLVAMFVYYKTAPKLIPGK
jgi:hypothetical protein